MTSCFLDIIGEVIDIDNILMEKFRNTDFDVVADVIEKISYLVTELSIGLRHDGFWMHNSVTHGEDLFSFLDLQNERKVEGIISRTQSC